MARPDESVPGMKPRFLQRHGGKRARAQLRFHQAVSGNDQRVGAEPARCARVIEHVGGEENPRTGKITPPLLQVFLYPGWLRP